MVELTKNYFSKDINILALSPLLPKVIKVRYKQSVIEYAHNRKIEFLKTEDYLSNCFEKYKDLYAGNIELNPGVLKLLDIQDKFKTLTNNKLRTFRIWIGAKNTHTHCHKDTGNNWVLQLKGKKKWLIFEPYDTENLYVNIKYKGVEQEEVSEVDVFNVDLNKYPLYSKTKPIEIICEAGDLLYIPDGWFHAVENIENSIMINTWEINENN